MYNGCWMVKERAPRRVPRRLFVFHGGAGTRLHMVAVASMWMVGRKPFQALAERVFDPLGGNPDPHHPGLLPLGEEHGFHHASPIGEDNMLDFGHFGASFKAWGCDRNISQDWNFLFAVYSCTLSFRAFVWCLECTKEDSL